MYRMIRAGLCLLAALVLSACGLTQSQIVKTQSFGTATAAIGELGEAEFVNIRDDIVAMNAARVALNGKKLPGNFSFEGAVSAEATAQRVAASQALRLYGELLVALVERDGRGNLQGIANQLADSTANALKRDLSDKHRDVLSGIAAGLGGLWLDEQKAKALRRIVPAYHDPLNELAALIRDDFALGYGARGFLAAYANTASRLKNSAMRLLSREREYNVLERERAVQALLMAEAALSRAELLGKRTGKAIGQLEQANAELLAVVQGGEISADGIRGYARQIQELASLRRVLAR